MSNTARPLMSQSTGSNPVVQATNPVNESVTNPANPIVDNPGHSAQVETSAAQHDWERRYKDLQSFHTKSLTELKAENAKLRSEGTPKFNPPKTEAELAQFKQENPETFAFIETIAHSISKNSLEQINGELTHVQSQYQQTQQERAINEMQRLHPDYMEIDSAPEFSQWLQTKNPKVQGWVINNTDDADSLSAALSLFKQETGWKANSSVTQSASQGATQPSGADFINNQGASEPSSIDPRKSIQYVWSEKEIALMRPDQFEVYEKDIELALNEGRVAIGR